MRVAAAEVISRRAEPDSAAAVMVNGHANGAAAVAGRAGPGASGGPAGAGSVSRVRTVFGLDPLQLHARFWASRGVQIVTPGGRSEIAPHAELFLLADPRTLALFALAPLAETMAWLRPDLVAVRLMDPQRDAYRERVVSGPGGRFVRFQRLYEGSDPRMVRVGLTDVHELARVWQDSASPRAGWERLRQLVPSADRHALTARGSVFDAASPAEQARFTRRLVETWKRPDATIEPVREVAPGVWAHERAVVEPGPAVRGPLWVGAGRKVTARDTAIGPAVMWDDGTACPEPREIRWLELEPLPAPTVRKGRRARGAAGPRRRGGERVKRALDVALALAALAVTLPLYPLIALAIVLEDGTPVFFRHTRETIGGKKFACLKFRSMRNDAEELKAALAAQNQADGPQFFIEHDPRMTRVGRLLRDLQFDELPQFINVLRGEMSVVGPRPSPFRENQYCPPWREARLSVRPGITGLWQISRTRAAGADFQEWIRYDIQYVENRSLRLDLWIIWQTVVMLVRKAVRS